VNVLPGLISDVGIGVGLGVELAIELLLKRKTIDLKAHH
jgi:hypothetical protein